jgi:FMN-dependent NADH-azoreductase
MSKTLLVNYTPRIGSNTKKLVDTFKAFTNGNTELTILDLSITPPDLLLFETLNTFLKANYSEETLTNEEEMLLKKNNTMTTELIQSDFIVLAFPMYNFSVPATVKAWLDAVIQMGKTFTINSEGFQGLCSNKKAMILTTTGYEVGEADFATPLTKTSLGFMGIESEDVVIQGLNQFPENADKLIEEANLRIENICNRWYQNSN